MTYKQYWKSEFQSSLNSLSGTKNIITWEEVSKEMESNDMPINEFVYRIKLKNPKASIIVYSSVDKETEKTRDVGSDAVRVIYEWITKDSHLYCKIAKRNRVESLFENLQQSIFEAAENCFDLGIYSWGDIEKALS